ncbi:DUF302 domain-containing protein [Loktanella sp. DJP18]|uniref:DUF302 domain-containing protein n=1 Tax=Loktanella sp. DJP18 TaxID=3409788 RepID=UPI003BB7F7F7
MAYTHDRMMSDTSLEDADMVDYLILAACNTKLAWEAIGIEPHISAMLPCNFIHRRLDWGTEVSAVDPAGSMSAVDTPNLRKLARHVRDMLVRAVDAA